MQGFRPAIEHRIPKLKEKKGKNATKTSAVVRYLANLIPDNGVKRIYLQVRLICELLFCINSTAPICLEHLD